MEDRQQSRKATVEELTAFIDSSHQQLDHLLSCLQWDKQDILAQTDEVKMRVCPVNPHHLVPETSYERHTQECELVAQGYSRQEQREIPASHSFFYASTSSVVPVLIDKAAQDEILSRVPAIERLHTRQVLSCDRSQSFHLISLHCRSRSKEVPRTVDRMDDVLTSAEKLAIHLAVLEKSKTVRQQATISLQDLGFDPEAALKKDEPAKAKTRLEILAELRDYKRRRQSYRAKNVHITRRSQTEIMRDVIDAQMKELQQALQPDEAIAEQRRSPGPDERRSRDASRSPIHSRSRQDDGCQSSNRSSHHDNQTDYPIRRADARSRDSSPSPGPSRSRHDRDRSRRRRSNERASSPYIKAERVERTGSRKASHSPRPLDFGRGEDSSSRTSTPHALAGVSIKIEKEARSRSPSQSRSPSRSRRDERGNEHRSHRHSKHKHGHKHKRHSRDSR